MVMPPGGTIMSAPTMSGPPSPPGQPSRPGEAPGKSGDAAKPGEGPAPVQRPTKPPVPPKPEELKVMPDEKGKVRFNFNGQPWPAVLEWLAKISGMSLDWRELPGDYLNLNTQRSYSVQEARDLINLHLLVRGFTILRQGEVLHVVNIKMLDPSLVPRLAPAELDRRDPHEFVKVSFDLESLMAAAAVDELKPMLSPNGKLAALAGTNRLEAMDAVINLREIYGVLKAEQSDKGQSRLVREFVLRYARAGEVQSQLQTLLGMAAKQSGMPPSQNSEQAQRQAMMMARMQEQQQERDSGQSGGRGQSPGAAQAKSETALVVNDHKNSILAYAPPDKMAVIAQAIEALDVPIDHSQSLIGNMSRMQVYRLVGVDPEPVVKTLEQMGNLDPSTRLEVDKKSKAIIAYASLADHVTIRAVVGKLSGSERSFAVRKLRRRPADQVAGTIAFMMGVEPKKKKKERRNSWYFDYEQSSSEPAERPSEFRVDADLEHNQLFLMANDVELAEVDNLLVKLGEIPAKGAGAENVRVIDSGSLQETMELLERLRREWPSVSPNPLVLPPAATKNKEPETPRPTSNRSEEPAQPERTTLRQPGAGVFRFAGERGGASAAGPQAEAAPTAPPPVQVAVGPDGKLVISSEDTQALDRLEELWAELASSRREYKIFHLKYAWAIDVELKLEDFFKDDNKKSKMQRPWYYYDYDDNQDDAEDDPRLSKRRKLKFISDTDTNSILVDGANPSQLKTIEELLQVYDQPPPRDAQSVRKHEVVRLKYAKAKVVADTVKDVFRDLLSSNDKALAGAPGQQKERTLVFDYGSSDDSGKADQRAPKFKGLLSIGIDDLSNTLVVSAPTYFFDTVIRMIHDLDEAAADNTVRVVKVGRGISAAGLQEVLDSVLGQGSSRGSAAAKRPARPRGGQPGEKNGPAPGSRPPREN